MISDDERGPWHALKIVLDESPEWLVTLAELIVLAAAFKAAAVKVDNVLLQGFGEALYLLALWHAFKPVYWAVVGPHFRFRKDERIQRLIFAALGGFIVVGSLKLITKMIEATVSFFAASGF